MSSLDARQFVEHVDLEIVVRELLVQLLRSDAAARSCAVCIRIHYSRRVLCRLFPALLLYEYMNMEKSTAKHQVVVRDGSAGGSRPNLPRMLLLGSRSGWRSSWRSWLLLILTPLSNRISAQVCAASHCSTRYPPNTTAEIKLYYSENKTN